MKNVLIIGGTSAIGQELTPLMTDYNVISVGSREYDVLKPGRTRFKDIDVVINLAAVMTIGNLSNHNLLTDTIIGVNCKGAVNILAEFLPGMKDRGYGRIIMMSSLYSKVNVPLTGVYSASKAFVDKLVKIAAIENGRYGVTVNSIQLGYTGVGMGLSRIDDMEKQVAKTALKRFCRADEILSTIRYIIDTEYLTGQNIRLDGGVR